MPYPASASVPKVPTKPVRTKIVPTVKSGETEAGIATSKILLNKSLLSINCFSLSLTGIDLLISLRKIITTITQALIRVAIAAPGTPI